MTLPSESNPYASPSDAVGTSFGPESGNRATVDNPDIIRALSGTRPWVLMLGILGMLGTLAMGLGASASVVAALRVPSSSRTGTLGIGNGLVFLVVAAICLAASLYLFSYGRRIGKFLRTRDQADLAAALLAQKSYWKLMGILAILYVVFVVLLIPLFFFWSFAVRAAPGPS